MSDRVRTSVLFSALLCLAACGGGAGAPSTSKCPEGMTDSARCTGQINPMCSAQVSVCVGGQWSTCGCQMASTTSPTTAAGGTTTGTTPAVCGNGKAEADEACDGTDLKGMTCASLNMGSASAMLKCNTRCTFDTLMCFAGGAMASGGSGAAQGGTGAKATTGSAGSGGSGR
jgi:hypothetical protein